MRYFWSIVIILVLISLGCSGADNLSSPDPVQPVEESRESHHVLWGFWQGIIDTEAQTVEFILLRVADMHLNALPFLEPPALINLTLESLEFNGDIIEADIGLRHPFLGLTEFTGFDVCGILITNGSVTGFSDTNLRMAGEGDTRLLNPDGYSRWWNPGEFPVNEGTIGSYNDGLLGAPDSFADYNSTLNGYKYFCDDLDDADDPLTEVTLANRGMFSAGQKNVRHYTIKMGTDGLIFNYAIDANWQFPEGDPPWEAPDDFPMNANRPEAYRISVTEVDNSLWNDGIGSGGGLTLDVDVYDWTDAELNTVRVESPGNFTMVETASATGGGDSYSTYAVDISNATPAEVEIELLISVMCEQEDFGGYVTGTNTTAYFTYTASVSNQTAGAYHWEFDDIDTFTGDHPGIYMASEFNQFGPALTEESDGDIALSWTGDDGNNVEPGIRGVAWVRRSTDNGVTYGYEAWRCWSVDSYHRPDTTKIAPGTLANAYSTSKYAVGAEYSDIFRVETDPVDNNRAALISYYADNLEIIVDTSGYIYAIDDSGNNIQAKHSVAPEILAPLFWNSDPPFHPWTIATNSSLSHSRSVGKDSSGTIWLAFYDNPETQIGLGHSTDTPPHEAWDASTVVYTAGSGISEVKNPSLWIDANDIFHICYTRYDSSSGNYQLVYTKDDSTFGNPTSEVIYEASTVINDAHISVGEKFGDEIIIFIYENGKSIFLYTLADGIPIGDPEEIDIGADDIDPDAILDADECDFHAVWATMDGDNYDVARRNGVLVED